MRIKDNNFLDTNILIYFFSINNPKLEITKEIIYSSNELTICSQVINEFINVCYKKLKLNNKDITDKIEIILKRFSIKYIFENTIIKALELKNVYQYSYYDSLILSSALENNCSTIYSEDFIHNQIIESSLKIINPFK